MSKFLIEVASLVLEHRLWGVWARVAVPVGSVIVAHGLWNVGAIAGVHGLSRSVDVGSPRIRHPTRLSSTGRRILYH